MDWAKDPGTGRLVSAAEASRGRYYRCPVCKADVFPRFPRPSNSRRYRQYHMPHFAHRTGQGSQKCELYHPADAIQHPRPSLPCASDGLARHETGVPPLSLSIELEQDGLIRGNRLREWGLRLTVPKSDDPHGRVSIDLGGKDVRTVALSKLSPSPLTYPVDPEAADFGVVWISPEVRPRFRAAIEGRIQGLDRERINVFAAGAQKYKPLSAHLSWGEAYYFVWRSEKRAALPRSLFTRPLANRGAWSCAMVTLPDESDSVLETWLRQSCGLNVSKERRRWGIVYPVAYDVDINGQIIIPQTNSLIIGTEAIEYSGGPTSKLDFSVSDAHASVPMSDRGQQIIEIKADGSHRAAAVRLSWNGNALPAIVRHSPPTITALPAVLVSCRPRNGGPLTEVGLHEDACRRLLHAVRERAFGLQQITIPKGVRGSIKWRGPSTCEWQFLPLTHPETNSTARTQVLTHAQLVQVNHALQDTAIEMYLEFGAFGEFYAPRENLQRGAGTSVRLAPELRRRIIWLCKTAQLYPDGDSRKLDRLADADLIRHFSCASIPPPFIAHKRSIQSALPDAKRRGRAP